MQYPRPAKRRAPLTPLAASFGERFPDISYRIRHLAIAALAAALALSASISRTEELLHTTREPGRPGGTLVVALRAEPKTFNPVMAVDFPSLTVIRRLMADLIHIDRDSKKTGAALAKSWSASPDGRRFTLELRRGIRFSDGHPLDAADVLFTFRVYLDEQVAAPHRDLLIVGGKPIEVVRLDSHTLRFELAEPYAVGERLFDSIPILPRHRLEEAYREGRLSDAWGLGTPPAEIVGLGPFRLEKYVPGERIEMVRNPHYWKIDRKNQRLPYFDRLVFQFVSSEDAQALRFQAGESHLTDRLGAKNYALLERDLGRGAAGNYVLRDLGPGLHYNFLFFNLNHLSGKHPEIEAKQVWFENVAFRRAISAAIDRDGIVRLVYRGKASAVASHVTPGSHRWANRDLSPPRRSLDTARQLLSSAGFSWDEKGTLHDAAGEPVRFSIVTNSSNTERVQIATIIQADLGELGIQVQVTPIEFRALLRRVFESYDYEACILALGPGDVDPNSTIAALTSGGANHFWRLARDRPPPPWQVEIDRLMERQLVELDPAERKKLYDRVQRLVAENLPMIFLVSPNVLTGAAAGLGNFTPAILDHYTLWNVDELFWRSSPGR